MSTIRKPYVWEALVSLISLVAGISLSIVKFGSEPHIAMLIGVVVGTYSSLFIATPVVYDTIKVTEKVEVEESKVYKGGKKKEKK